MDKLSNKSEQLKALTEAKEFYIKEGRLPETEISAVLSPKLVCNEVHCPECPWCSFPKSKSLNGNKDTCGLIYAANHARKQKNENQKEEE